MAAKRAVKAKEEAKENKANEAIRRKAGRVRRSPFELPSMPNDVSICVYPACVQDIQEIREEMQQKELLKEAEAKRRGMSLLMPSPYRPILMHLNLTRGMYRESRGCEGAGGGEGAD